MKLSLRNVSLGLIGAWTIFGLAEVWDVSDISFKWTATLFILSVTSLASIWLTEKR